jgi:hypothetical protein
MSIEAYIESLRDCPAELFNPWYDVDPENDAGPEAPAIRRRQLQHYLESRLTTARFIFMAEAIGYQGGHFSGMAMTSERILLGHLADRGILPEHVLPDIEPQRTSKPSIKPLGFSEPTASIVWRCLIEAGMDPMHVVLWNTLPWHPFNPDKGMLSNRTPTNKEMTLAPALTAAFLELYPRARVVAVGKKCAGTMAALGIECPDVRHPANGGAGKFRSQVGELLADRH